MTKNLLNATKIEQYSPEGTFNLWCILDEYVLPCEIVHYGVAKSFFIMPAFQVEDVFCNV
jgi:hypothetical protein